MKKENSGLTSLTRTLIARLVHVFCSNFTQRQSNCIQLEVSAFNPSLGSSKSISYKTAQFLQCPVHNTELEYMITYVLLIYNMILNYCLGLETEYHLKILSAMKGAHVEVV
jgi:hypothetical protein